MPRSWAKLRTRPLCSDVSTLPDDNSGATSHLNGFGSFLQNKKNMSFHFVFRGEVEALPFGWILDWLHIIFRRATGAVIY